MADGTNLLYYGDNLQILRDNIADASVDLIYLDPPFNSNRSYNVLFKNKSGDESMAQIEAFDDTWSWSQDAEEQYREIVSTAPVVLADAMEAMRKLLGDNDVLAYLVMMTARLVELHRVLKPTGALYLHCDPTASHYLKIMLDAIFGIDNFRSEVIWKRTTAHNSAKRFGPVHDVIFFYSKSKSFTWNKQFQAYDESYVKSKYRFEDDRVAFASATSQVQGRELVPVVNPGEATTRRRAAGTGSLRPTATTSTTNLPVRISPITNSSIGSTDSTRWA